MKLTFIQWLIQGIPECIALVLLGFVLLESRMDIKRALIPGVIQALVLYFVRLFPLPFGIHTMVAIISLSVLLLCFTEARYSKALLISFFVYLVLGLSELMILPVASYLLKTPLDIIFSYLDTVALHKKFQPMSSNKMQDNSYYFISQSCHILTVTYFLCG